MRKSFVVGLLALAFTWAPAPVMAQTAPATGQPSSAGPMLAPGTIIGAELSKGVDAKKAKVGQEVTAKSLGDLRDNNGNLVIPRGSKLVGHVTEVKAASKQEPQSTLAIIFDKVQVKHGKESKEIGMHAAIQALEQPPRSFGLQEQQPSAGAGGGAPSAGGPAGGGGMGPAGSGGARPGGSPSQGQSPEMGGGDMGGGQQGGGAPTLNANSHGVIGIPNLTLSPEATPTQGSVLNSSKGNVKLDGGTMMVLRVIGQ